MKHLNLLIFISIFTTFLTSGFAQTNVLWQECFGGANDDRSHYMKETSDGGIVSVGYTLSTSMNGVQINNHGGKDGFILKLNSSGNVQWLQAIGGTNDETINMVKELSDGSFILVGTSASNNGDVGVAYGAKDVWVIKLSATGAILWSKVIGGMSNDEATALVPTSDGGFIVAGYSFSANIITAIGGSAQATGNHGNSDAWAAKLDSLGNVQWQKCFGGTQSDRFNSVIQLASGNYIMAGYSESNNCDVSGNHLDYNFFPPLTTQDCWIVNIDPDGAIIWQKSVGGSVSENVNDLAETLTGDIVFTGYSYSNDGDISTNNGQKDIIVGKISTSGSMLWCKTTGGIYDDLPMSINILPSGGFLLSGSTNSSTINNVNVPVSGNYDFFMMYLDYNGVYQNHTLMGGTGWDYARSVVQTTSGDYVVAGYTNSLNGTFSGNNGSYDFGVVKLSAAVFPVELLNFDATLEAGNTYLNWQTNQEVNSAFFGIERSLDNGVSFELLDNIEAAGNSESPLAYKFIDYDVSNLDNNKVFYRLKMVDIDNSFRYSNTIEVNLKNENQIYANVYPVPAKDELFLDYQLFGGLWGEIKIMNQIGQVMYRAEIDAENIPQNIRFDVRDWEAGVYFLQIYTEEKTITRKFIKN